VVILDEDELGRGQLFNPLTRSLRRKRILEVKAEEIEDVLAPFWETTDGRTAAQRAEIYGIDLSLITENLRLTPEGRIDQHQAALELALTLQKGRR
jgi:hypothetical protein